LESGFHLNLFSRGDKNKTCLNFVALLSLVVNSLVKILFAGIIPAIERNGVIPELWVAIKDAAHMLMGNNKVC
jgi:hypothetical protein